METGKRHIDIDELFRSKLENAIAEPSPDFSRMVMKKAARKEFMRFNPSRFNIYYAGFIAAGLISAGILVFSGKEKAQEIKELSPETGNAIIVVPSENPADNKSVRMPVLRQNEKNEKNLAVGETKTVQPVSKEETVQTGKREDPIKVAGVNGSHQKTGFFEGPSGSKSIREMQPEASLVLFAPSALAGCAPLRLTFSNYAASYEKFTWNFGDGGQSEAKEPEWTFNNPGEYTVTLNASAPGKPVVSHSIPIKVYAAPKADFEISPKKVIIPDEEVRFVNYSRDAVAYRWDFGDGNRSALFEPGHRYTRFGNYNVKLVAISEHGCADSVLVSDAFSGSAYFIEMPNAFIPNTQGPSGGFYTPKSDESAEIFHPSYSGISVYRMQIFSKRGVLLFETNDINVGWDGYYKGELSNPGVYVWKVFGRFSNGQTFSKMGDLTLLKKLN